jgi:hypothetical protein
VITRLGSVDRQRRAAHSVSAFEHAFVRGSGALVTLVFGRPNCTPALPVTTGVLLDRGADREPSPEAVASLFSHLSVPRCTPDLLHLSEADAVSLNGVCYMWWDRFPCLALLGDPNLRTMHEVALRTMARILGL